MPPTRPNRSGTGSQSGRIGMCTSRQPARPGSIRSSASLLSSQTSKSDAAFTNPQNNSKPTFEPSSMLTTQTRSPSAGPNPQTTSWPPFSASAPGIIKSVELQNQDTSVIFDADSHAERRRAILEQANHSE